MEIACACGCGELIVPRTYRKDGKQRITRYKHGHHKGNLGKSHPAWNKGLTKEECPTLAKMGYQPGHAAYNDFSKINDRLKNDPEFKEKWRKAKSGKTPWNKGIPLIAIRGENHPKWKGGKPSHPRDYSDYKLFRIQMYRRDNYTCKKCGDKNDKGRGSRIRLHLHHILPFTSHPHLALEPSNVITVCYSCHLKLHGRTSKRR